MHGPLGTASHRPCALAYEPSASLSCYSGILNRRQYEDCQNLHGLLMTPCMRFGMYMTSNFALLREDLLCRHHDNCQDMHGPLELADDMWRLALHDCQQNCKRSAVSPYRREIFSERHHDNCQDPHGPFETADHMGWLALHTICPTQLS